MAKQRTDRELIVAIKTVRKRIEQFEDEVIAKGLTDDAKSFAHRALVQLLEITESFKS